MAMKVTVPDRANGWEALPRRPEPEARASLASEASLTTVSSSRRQEPDKRYPDCAEQW
jgi:hypothetical protein